MWVCNEVEKSVSVTVLVTSREMSSVVYVMSRTV